jgi:hypothetical protein
VGYHQLYLGILCAGNMWNPAYCGDVGVLESFVWQDA